MASKVTVCLSSTLAGSMSTFASPAVSLIALLQPLLGERLQVFIPFVGDRVQAGFPSPAEDFNTKRVDLTEELITHPQATFLVSVRGDSMREAGIFDGDTLIVDRALRPAHRSIVVAIVDSEFTVSTCTSAPARSAW